MKGRTLIAWALSVGLHLALFVVLGAVGLSVGKAAKDDSSFLPVELLTIEEGPQKPKDLKKNRQAKKKTTPKKERVAERKTPKSSAKVAELKKSPALEPKPKKPQEEPKPREEVAEPAKKPAVKTSPEPAHTEEEKPLTAESTKEEPLFSKNGRVGIEDELSRFKRLVKEKIEQAKFYPIAARKRGYEGVVGVAFSIDRDGRVEDVRVSSPCKCEILNRAACEVIRRASPFPPLPDSLRAENLEMEVNIIFKLD